MKTDTISTLLSAPVGRLDFVLVACLFISSMGDLVNALGADRQRSVFFPIMIAVLVVPLWALGVRRRLISLNSRQVWSLPILAIAIAIVIAVLEGWGSFVHWASLVLLVIQLPLIVLPANKRKEQPEVSTAAEPTP